MKVPQKIIKQINFISFIDEAIRQHIQSAEFIDSPPEIWSNSEKELFDAMAFLECKIKEKVVEILTSKTKQ